MKLYRTVFMRNNKGEIMGRIGKYKKTAIFVIDKSSIVGRLGDGRQIKKEGEDWFYDPENEMA